jgi:hypothetical protein
MAEPERRLRPSKQYYLYFNDDGLMELCLGAGMLLAGLTMNPLGPEVALLWIVVAAVAILFVKSGITAPRLKQREIDPASVRRAAADTRYSTIRMASAAVTVVVAVTLLTISGVLGESQGGRPSDLLRQPEILVIGVISACFGAGIRYKAPRLAVYGALATILFVITLFSNLSLALVLVITGLVMVLTGGVFLVRFLQSYPASGDSR